ncbi:interferon-induced protein with tetratricopeptide repeats 5-like isoform X1 [Octopus sinensis]|uniref:Interferon-induced protein with tetratricopeptide repeats 5-like isoform X1 n=1 Tax=Octopus sinensis TaxID=2607531 RepID=A0A6P7TE62_9MOLL|nr:interferon-induced protein with tetratricopeptide repeats 5-like isoform X1 [Octopus sinensis]
MAEEMQKITGKMQEILQDEGSRRESYRERIKRFPNVMEESFEKTKEVWSSLYKKVENSLNDDILFGLEDEIRQKNVLVYILWQMNDKFSAEKLANEVREKKPDNLVALTNLAFIHLYDGNIPEVRNLLDNLSKLEERENFSLIEAEGKRNVAYCLATISFEDHERAVELYKESLNVCPDDYLCMFSIALLQYRCLRKNIDKEKRCENIKESIQYLEKIRCAFPRHIDKGLMGRTLALIGLFQLSPYNFHSQPAKKYFQRALHISPDDRYVLEKSAYHYIRSNQLEQGRKLLEKAIEIKATSYSHHRLGLLYLRMDTPKYTYVPMNKQFSKETNVFAKVLKHAQSIPHRERNELINKAEYHFQQALELSHECSATLYDIILLYMSLKEYDNARKYCERFKADNKMQDVNFNILFGKLCFKEADVKNDEEEKDQLRCTGMDWFVLALKSAVKFLPFDKDLIEIWEIKEIILDLYEYGNGNTEYKKFVLEFIQSVEDLANDKAFQNILHKSEL